MAAPMIRVTILIFLVILQQNTGRRIDKKDMKHYRQRVAEMFHHAYDGYIKYGYPYDELRPITCDGHDTWGSYSLTLIDALDMLVVMGNNTEFRRVAQLVMDRMNFNVDINVSVFETNIRVLGGLLSAHLMSKRAGMDLEVGWPCSGPFLRMAEDVGRRLLPAFDTPTGMPYGTVNLMHGVPKGETTVTCTAGVGTFIVEFGALSRLTGDPIFEKVAIRALRALWKAKSDIKLVGNHIDVATGKWTALDGGIGGGIDSYFEYLVKGSIMLNNPELLEMFNEYLPSIEKYLKRDDWYMWAHMMKGSISLPVFTSLDCYWPGIQAMLGDIDKAMKTIHNFHQVWKQFGFLPEFYNIVKNEAHAGREGYPLRPELVESAMYLYQATKDPYLLEIGVDMLESIEHNTRTKCGYATVKNVNTHSLENRMESFFLAETTKYLYLLFDEDNFIHNTGGSGTVIQTPNGECVLDAGGYIFNSEAHPVDMAALYCCSAEKKDDDKVLQDFHDNIDLLALLDITDRKDTVRGIKWSKEKRKSEHEFQNIRYGGFSETLKSSLKGDHQNIMSTEGKAFKLDQLQNVEVTLSGNKVHVTMKEPSTVSSPSLKTEDPTKEGSQTDFDQTHPGGSCSEKGDNTCTEETRDEKLKYQKLENSKNFQKKFHSDKDGTNESSESNDKVDDDNDDVEEEEEEEGEEDDPFDEKEKEDSSDTQQTFVEVSEKESNKEATKVQPKKSKQLTSNINDVLKLLQSFTSDLLGKGDSERNIRLLHEKLKYYSLFQRSRPDLMMCKAQPFHMSLSVMGEMFLENQ